MACDLRVLNRIEVAVERSMEAHAMIEAEYGVRDDGMKEAVARLLMLVAIKRAQAMAA